MIKVRLLPEQGIRVGLNTTYIYDNSLIMDEVELAKDWATKVNGKVSEEGEEVDYSAKAWAIGGTGTETNNAKYYSEQSANSATASANSASDSSDSAISSQTWAGTSQTWAGKAEVWAEGTDEQVEALDGEHSSKGWALASREYMFGGAIYDDDNERIEMSPAYQDLAEVAKTNSYNDLDDKPTIGSGVLTIQKNSVTVDTFGANATSNKTINITVPTQASDISALSASTKYGASLSLSINNTTYVVTAQLKDQDGNNLGSAQTIDLPLESVVVNGSYDDDNKKIVLTLQSGSTIDIPVADLVAGLQSEITSDNMLDADLVDDSTSTNKFVTASDKTTWSGKQDALGYTAENAANKVTSLSNASTDTQYPSAKCVYDGLGSKVSDVTINSTSVVTAGVAVIPLSENGTYGVIKLGSDSTGLILSNSGTLQTRRATDADVGSKTQLYRPIVPANLDLAVKTGVTTNTISLTDAEKTDALTWLGSEKIVALASGDSITLQKNAYYNGGTVTSFSITCPAGATNSFCCEIDFTSGATATTITYNSTINWVDGSDSLVYSGGSAVFTPAVSTRYNVIIWYDGTQWNGIAKVVG